MESNVAPKPQAPPETAQALRLEISISGKSWVSVDRDGKSAIRKIMEPGEAQALNAEEKFLIILGNAGGVQIKINGKPAKPLGKPGDVVKVLIDRNNMQDFLEKAAG
jgi:cytoskeleton protein RodZ